MLDFSTSYKPLLQSFQHLQVVALSRRFAKRFYRSKAWDVARAAVIERQHGLCADCLANGELVPIAEVHHIQPLTPKNITDPNITISLDNLVGLCRDCHIERHKHIGTYKGSPAHTKTRVWFDENGIPHKKGDVV
ncbi:HNH endonuclease [uncultured Olegusella sp.]|uniref:HNH endonuclease n=1 Tax=uncultured Olegusella sp. TaxID=1979846 RepID=UPI00345CBB06